MVPPIFWGEDDPFVMIWLPNAIHATILTPDAQRIVDELDSYAEHNGRDVLDSGTWRIVRATKHRAYLWLPRSGVRFFSIGRNRLRIGLVHRREIEVISANRPVRMTGYHLSGTPRTINARQNQLDALLCMNTSLNIRWRKKCA